MSEFDRLTEAAYERDLQNIELDHQASMDLMARKIAAMKEANALEDFNAEVKRMQSEYSLRQAEAERNNQPFDFEKEISSFERSLQDKFTALGPSLNPQDRKAKEYEFETSLISMKAKALETMGKMEAKRAKEALDLRSIEFKNALDSRDPTAIEAAHNESLATLENLRTSGALDELQAKKFEDEIEEDFKGGKIDALTDAYENMFFNEGPEEALGLVKKFMGDKKFESYNTDQRAKVFKLRRRAEQASSSGKDSSTLTKRANEMKKISEGIEEDFYAGKKGAGLVDYHNTNLQAQKANAEAIAATKNKGKKQELMRENVKLKLSMRVSTLFSAKFLDFLGKDRDALIDMLDKDLEGIPLRSGGKLTEAGLYVKDKLSDLQGKYFDNNAESAELVNNYISQYLSGDEVTQDLMDSRVKAIVASEEYEWNQYLNSVRNPRTKSVLQRGIGKNAFITMSGIRVREAFTKGRTDILKKEADVLQKPMLHTL